MSLNKLMLLLVVLCVTLSAADTINLRANQQVQQLGAQRMNHETIVSTVAGEEITLKLLKDYGDGHYRYVQLYNGIPVWGRSITVAEGQRGVECMHGDVVTGLQFDVRNVVPAMDAKLLWKI